MTKVFTVSFMSSMIEIGSLSASSVRVAPVTSTVFAAGTAAAQGGVPFNCAR
jgi:hypothetical protein